MSESTERPFSPAVEDYLKAIFKLQEADATVSTNALAQKIGATPAAVSKMIKQLSSLHLIHYEPYYGVRLTLSGERVALEVIRHHRLLELYLHDTLGYGWDQVDTEAEQLEHHISEAFEEKIDRLLNYPSFDPHGDPIPTRDGYIAPRAGKPLGESEPGETLVVLRVRDSDPEVLRYLKRLGLTLETVVRVTDKQPFNGPLTVLVGDRTHSIGRELAEHIFVTEPDS